MDSKYVGGFIAFLVLGLGIGYLTFNNNQIELEISTLESQLEELQKENSQLSETLFEVDQNYVELTNEHEALVEQFSELSSSNVAKSVYDELESQYSDLLSDYEGLETDISELQSQYDELDSQYQELSDQYDELLRDYELVNGPQSTYTSFDDLVCSIQTEKTVYNYTESLSGLFTIYFEDGTPFVGSLKLKVGGTSGWTFPVNGTGTFYINSPVFRYGPQMYDVGFYYLYDKDGFIIADAGDLSHVKVTVEAK